MNDVAAHLTIITMDPMGVGGPMDPTMTSLEFQVGGTASLGAVASNALGLVVGDVSASWSSSDPAVAAVSSSGVVTAQAEGSAEVTAAYGEVSASLAVVVTEAKGTS